jgi:thioesterase domain-containing protein
LTTAGEEVPLLALFDTYAPGLHMEAVQADAKPWNFFKKAILRGIVRRALRNGGPVPARFRNFYITDTYDKAVLSYRPKPYHGKLTVLKAETSWGPKEMGWTALAQGGLNVQVVPGDHYNMIKEPNVGRIAEHLARLVPDGQERASGVA